MNVIFRFSNSLVLPLWVTIITLPRWRWTERIMKSPLVCAHSHVPMKRMATAEEFAAFAVALASDYFPFMTGAQMVIDGGKTAKLAKQVQLIGNRVSSWDMEWNMRSQQTLHRVLALIVLLLGASTRLMSQSETGSLIIRVTGARNSKGQIALALFQSEAGFPGDSSKAVRTQQSEIDPQTRSAKFVIQGIPQGVYAVSVFHDENMNGKLDKNFVGAPKEGYGASNNPRKRMGPPPFDEAKFSMNQPEQLIEIKLIY